MFRGAFHVLCHWGLTPPCRVGASTKHAGIVFARGMDVAICKQRANVAAWIVLIASGVPMLFGLGFAKARIVPTVID